MLSRTTPESPAHSAGIADALMLVLLDNASARPSLDRTRRRRAVAAAALLDLAAACRIRPAGTDDPAPEGTLVVLAGPELHDPIATPALDALTRRPMTPGAAISELARHTEDRLLAALVESGLIVEIRLQPSVSGPAGIAGRRPRRSDRYAWLLTDRGPSAAVRDELLAVLVDGEPVRPATAALITLLHAVDGLHDLLSLEPRVWPTVELMAAEIASGGWVLGSPQSPTEPEPTLAEVNLAVTTAAVCSALR